MDLGFINGMMVDNMKECGLMVSNMVKDVLLITKKKLKRDFGKTASEFNG